MSLAPPSPSAAGGTGSRNLNPDGTVRKTASFAPDPAEEKVSVPPPTLLKTASPSSLAESQSIENLVSGKRKSMLVKASISFGSTEEQPLLIDTSANGLNGDESTGLVPTQNDNNCNNNFPGIRSKDLKPSVLNVSKGASPFGSGGGAQLASPVFGATADANRSISRKSALFNISPNAAGESRGGLSPSKSKSERQSQFVSVAPMVKENYIRRLRLVFDIIDTDCSGFVDYEEISDFLQGMGKKNISIKQVMQLVSFFDINKKGALNFEEFLSLMESIIPVKELYSTVSAGAGDSTDLTKELENLAEKMTKAGNLNSLSTEKEQELQNKAKAISPSGKELEPYEVSQLRKTPYHLVIGGFVCNKCDINSENLVNKIGYFSPSENYVLCCICAKLSREKNLTALRAQALKDRSNIKLDKPGQLPGFASGGRKKKLEVVDGGAMGVDKSGLNKELILY